MRRLLPLVLLVPALAACGTTTVNGSEIESQVRKATESAIGMPIASVSCPGDIEAKKGTGFTCTVKGKDGTTAKATGSVTAVGDKARFNANTPVIHTGAAEQQMVAGLKQQLKVDAQVDCPDLVTAKAGGTYTCKATAGEQSRDIDVTQRDDQGNIHWELG